MVGHLCPDSTWHLPEGSLCVQSFCDRVQTANRPLFIGATAFALAALLEQRPTIDAPYGSVLMVTGGFKGRTVSYSDAEMYKQAAKCFANTQIVTEYGMTELSSQLWGRPGQPYHPPPWMKVWACDPVTGRNLPINTIGQLRFFDLANIDGALVIETMDQGFVDDNGHVTLLGRLPDAEVRGCSLTVEDPSSSRSRS